MIFVDSIDELQYYNAPPFGECYCDLVTGPQDIYLQAVIPTYDTKNPLDYLVNTFLYDPSGTTNLANLTTNTSWVIFKSSIDGKFYLNIRFDDLPTSVCNAECFILNVVVTRITSTTSPLVVFNKFTERYCIDQCCYGDIGDMEIRLGTADGEVIYMGDGQSV